LERVLEVGSKFSSNSLEALVRLAISMDSRIKALLAHLLKLLTNPKLLCHLILRGLGGGNLYAALHNKCQGFAAWQQLRSFPVVLSDLRRCLSRAETCISAPTELVGVHWVFSVHVEKRAEPTKYR